MSSVNKTSSLILGVALFLGLSTLGWFLSNAAIEYKEYERTVTVKGLAEQEFTADIVIWPIQFTLASNNLQGLYNDVDSNTNTIISFLTQQGIKRDDVTISAPAITDKSAQQYGGNQRVLHIPWHCTYY